MDMLKGEKIAEADLTDWRKLAQGLHARYLVDDFGTGARFVVAVDGVGAEQLQVDVSGTHRHGGVVRERVARCAHRGDEPGAGAEVVDQVAGMQPLGQLAPVGQPCPGHIVARQHVHRDLPPRARPWSRTLSGVAEIATAQAPPLAEMAQHRPGFTHGAPLTAVLVRLAVLAALVLPVR